MGCASTSVWRYQGWVGGFCGGLRPPHLPPIDCVGVAAWHYWGWFFVEGHALPPPLLAGCVGVAVWRYRDWVGGFAEGCALHTSQYQDGVASQVPTTSYASPSPGHSGIVTPTAASGS